MDLKTAMQQVKAQREAQAASRRAAERFAAAVEAAQRLKRESLIPIRRAQPTTEE